jgi:hypothetical protein
MMMRGQSKIGTEQIEAQLQPRGAAAPPLLPTSWTAAALFMPFGDANPNMTDYDQVMVANIAYDASGSQPAMRVSLYLLENLQYFDFLFTSGQWYWLISAPGQQPTGYYGPFATPLQVPSPNFLAQNEASYGNSWPISGVQTDGWMIPTPNQPNDVPPHGTWYSLNSNTGALWRVLNLDNNNPVSIPFLGAFYLAYLPGFAASGPLNLLSLVSGTPSVGNAPSQMVTQRDIQSAISNPLAAAPCTMPQIQSVISGIDFPAVQPPLPAWTDKTFIQGWTIGCDPIPYWTEVWYWWSNKTQRSSFVGLGQAPGEGSYRNRSDIVLYSNFFTSPAYYEISAGRWVSTCPNPCFPGVGIPRPDFVAADGGVVKATITGNADFGLDPQQTLQVIRVSMPRGPNPNGIDVTSLFWFWFTDDQRGVLFSEGNYIDTVTAHDLQVIDYAYFERNASDNVNANSFEDPCKVDECKPPPAALAARLVRHGRF